MLKKIFIRIVVVGSVITVYLFWVNFAANVKGVEFNQEFYETTSGLFQRVFTVVTQPVVVGVLAVVLFLRTYKIEIPVLLSRLRKVAAGTLIAEFEQEGVREIGRQIEERKAEGNAQIALSKITLEGKAEVKGEDKSVLPLDRNLAFFMLAVEGKQMEYEEFAEVLYGFVIGRDAKVQDLEDASIRKIYTLGQGSGYVLGAFANNGLFSSSLVQYGKGMMGIKIDESLRKVLLDVIAQER